jgi:hypothetical protein
LGFGAAFSFTGSGSATATLDGVGSNAGVNKISMRRLRARPVGRAFDATGW